MPFDRVASGRYRPEAPTDPYVLALEHTVLQIMAWLRVGNAITHPKLKKRPQVVYLRRLFRQPCYPLLLGGHGYRISMHSPCFSRGPRDPTPRFPPLAPAGGRSPASPVLSRRYDILPPVPPRFVAFAWRYLSVHPFCSLPGGRVRRRGLELVTRVSGRDLR